jgi:hypothetical protein
VHIDPEDDESCSPCDHLPLREELLAGLQVHWAELPAFRAIEDIPCIIWTGRFTWNWFYH